jgi:hypothetical protein
MCDCLPRSQRYLQLVVDPALAKPDRLLVSDRDCPHEVD